MKRIINKNIFSPHRGANRVYIKPSVIICLFTCLASSYSYRLFSQEPQQMIDSPVAKSQSNGLKSTSATSPYDLERFFKMDNPKAAAALKIHIQEFQLSLDKYPFGYKSDYQYNLKGNKSGTRFLIHNFNETEFTPEAGIEPELKSQANEFIKAIEDASKAIIIIQFQSTLTLRNVLELLESDVKIYDRVGDNSFIVRMPVSNVNSFSVKPYVRWIGSYKTEYKYSPTPSQSIKPGAFIYPLGGDRPEYREDLEQLGIRIRGYDNSAFFYDVLLDVSMFESVAQLWWVKGILKEPEEILENNNLQVMAPDITVNYEPYDSRKLIMADKTSFTGSGIIIGVRDDGVDINHPQLLNIFNSQSENTSAKTHGTHVVGIIAGRNASINGPWGVTDIHGVAPGVSIIFRETDLTALGYLGYSNDFSKFINYSSKITNHSYMFKEWFTGEPDFHYDNNTTNFDAYCDNDDLLIIKSAGNEYNTLTITNSGTGKNVIVVGAINYVTRSNILEENYILGQRSNYSSQGPTLDDHRLKPELVAPGGDGDYLFEKTGGVVSTTSNPWDLTHSGLGTGAVNGNYEFPEWESDDNYIRVSGTSMAAPHVTGVLAKMKEWKNDITSELAKALLINTTIPIKANSTDPLSGYANTQVGYGLVNAYSITNTYSGESKRLLFGTGTVTEEDLYQDWTIDVSANAKKLIVTLAYNDQEGEESNDNALKDDLDLTLISPSGTSYSAYNYKPSGVTNESPLEKMIIVNPEPGTWKVNIYFTYSPDFNNLFVYATQNYGVVAHEIYKEPDLTLTASQSTINVTAGQEFTLQPTITNSGGYIAVGVTVKVTKSQGLGSFGGDINKSRYVGNLMYQNDFFSPQISLTAPTTIGTYELKIEADGINKEFDNSSYPKIKYIAVNVVEPTFTISGYVRTSNGSTLSGVTMSGLPGNPVTNSIGYYTAIVNYGWSGTITPVLAGYYFTSSYYSNVISDQTCDFTGTVISNTIQDIDGNYYNIVTIGSQIWMAENLKTTKYNDGTAIPLKNDNGEWSTLESGAYCYYDNNETNKYAYGALYNWYTVDKTSNGNRNVCPTGWHVPSDVEWTLLTDNMGGEIGAGGKLKESGYTHWNNPNTGATNVTGFTALPGGKRYPGGSFSQVNSFGYWWSSTESGSLTAFYRSMWYGDGDVAKSYFDKTYGFSVRCLKDPVLPTSTISGYTRKSEGTAISGVIMNGLPGNPSTTSSGYYEVTVSYGWSGTVTPALPGYDFAPISTSYSNVTDNQSTNYTGTLWTYTISGYTRTSEGSPITGVILNGLPGNPSTNSSGYYTATVNYGWSGTVTPVLAGYDFTSSVYTNVISDQTEDYTGLVASSTAPVTSITKNSAVSGGFVTTDIMSPVTARGVCWSTVPNPTVDLATKTIDGTGTGAFVSTITGLTAGTTYYVRAYFTLYYEHVETTYMDEISFTTYISDAITDIDGNYYNTVTIGKQVWMKENLKTTRYNDGTSIVKASDQNEWNNLDHSPEPTIGGYCWYDNSESYKNIYGNLYNYAAVHTDKLCPTGWHVPSVTDVFALQEHVGLIETPYYYDFGKLKEAGTSHWQSPNFGATNESGFTGLPGGMRTDVGFEGLTFDGYFWTSDYRAPGFGIHWGRMRHDNILWTFIGMLTSSRDIYGYSVRCIKDEVKTSIALNKKATASSYISPHVPSRANDADRTNNNYWAASSYPQWWKVDLGNVYDISEIVVRNYVDGYRYYQYNIEASSDDQTYIQIAAKTNTDVATDVGDSYPVTTTARYLRVNMTYNSANPGVHISDFSVYGSLHSGYIITSSAGPGGIVSPMGEVAVASGADQTFIITPDYGYQIAEILVDGNPVEIEAGSSYTIRNVTATHTISANFSPAINIAFNKSAMSESVFASGFEAFKANDADASNSSYWAAGSYPQWWEVDMGGYYDISCIVIRNYVDGNRYYQYNIEGSLDGQTYTPVASKSNTNMATDDGDRYSIRTTARYLRVNMTYNSANPGVHISDFRVYGMENIALNKHTESESVFAPGYESSRGNDLNSSNSSYWAASSYPQWWKVDLGNVYNISEIIIRNYVDGYRYYQYNIEGSMDDQTYDPIPGATKTNTDVATDEGDSYLVNSTARYLRVNMTYNSVNPGVHISDFKVHGTLVGNLITSSAGPGGVISPLGEVAVPEGADQTFIITPDCGYQVADVLVDNSSVGIVSSYTFPNVTTVHKIEATFSPADNIALNKHTYSESFFAPGYESLKANDGNGSNSSYWAASSYPQWWKVDLGDYYDISCIVIRNYTDGFRYYQYNIEGSSDDQVYTRIAEKTNASMATDGGDSYPVSASARYLRVNMTYNSANPGVHISDFRVYGTLHAGGKGLTLDSPDFKKDKITETEQKEIKVNVYPNPFRDQVTIRIDSPNDEMFDISVIGLNGGTVYLKTEIPGNTENTFNLQLAKGMYILIVNNKESRVVYRIVKL